MSRIPAGCTTIRRDGEPAQNPFSRQLHPVNVHDELVPVTAFVVVTSADAGFAVLAPSNEQSAPAALGLSVQLVT